MARQQGGKGNPASKRMSNEARKRRHARCRENTRLRKEARRAAARDAEARNRDLRARGELTPWEASKAAAGRRRERERAKLPHGGTS
jgi:hypothetical protein